MNTHTHTVGTPNPSIVAALARARLMSTSSIDLRTATLDELRSADAQLREEVTAYGESLHMLSKAVSRYHASGRAIEALSKETVGKDMLIPLTESLYVPGKIAKTNGVLLDVGTGYFIEHDAEKGIDYCKRKVNFIRENVDALMELLTKKRKQLVLVQDFMRARMQEQAQATQAGA